MPLYNPAIQSISAGTTRVTSGEAILSNLNGVSFGVNGQTITASIDAGATATGNFGAIAAGTQTATSGTAILSNANGITFGMAGSATITASVVGPATLQVWDNLNAAAGTIVLSFGVGTSNGTLLVGPLHQPSAPFPGVMTAATMLLDMSGNPSGAQSNSHTFTARIGIYTASASTLSLLNSVSRTFGASANDATNSQLYMGLRYLTIHSSAWSASPSFSQTQYFVALNMESSNGAYDMSWLGQRFQADAVRSGTVGAASTSGNTSMGWLPYIGIYSATTNAMPGSIHISELQKTGSLTGANFMPHVQFNNQVSAF